MYILRSEVSGRLYVGQTDDLDRRLLEHQDGRGGKYTSRRGPWVLVHKEEHVDRSSAVRRERFLKSVQGSREKRRLAQAGA